MKKLLCILILACCGALAFAQNVYQLDLNKFPATNETKTAAYDKASKTVTLNSKGDDANLFMWLEQLDISKYNIIRIRYSSLDNCGFYFSLNYADSNVNWQDAVSWCPSYLSEVVIPLISGQKKLNGISINKDKFYCYDKMRIKLESITLEKVDNPKKTDFFDYEETPVIDTAATVTINAKATAWDFVKGFGVGKEFLAFLSFDTGGIDTGLDYNYAGERRPTKEILHFLKEKGFTSIRLQTHPGTHLMDDKYTIHPTFLKMIKETIDWAIEEGLYVILCGPPNDVMNRPEVTDDANFAGYLVSADYKKESEAFLKAVWKQYATAFNNSYDEHLVFETLNEPIDRFHEHNFYETEDCAVCKKDFAILNEYNQLIVDTIRSTGGNNANRFIMVEGLAARWSTIATNLFKLPKDKAKNKLIPTIHNYPMGYPQSRSIYTDALKKDVITDCFAALDKYYFSKKIPVIVSEINTSRFNNVVERINCIKDFMVEVNKPNRSCAVSFFECPDNDDTDGFRYYDRETLEWLDQEYVNTFLYAARGKDYPLSQDFIKQHEIKFESITGKNLLKEPVEMKSWDNMYKISGDSLYRTTPSKYKFVFEFEKTGSEPILQFGYIDLKKGWYEIPPIKNVKIKGGTLKDGWCIAIKDNVVELSIDSALAKDLAESENLVLNGQQIIIKSVKVVE